ncbi:MAG: hypothetical protein WAW92_04550 [Minisyncoccia bacterium]
MSTNNFHPDDRLVWLYHDYSGWSGKNGDVVLDHILLRSGKDHDSVLNSIPILNHSENIAMHGELHTPKNQAIMLRYTIKHVLREVQNGSYQWKPRDLRFYEKYKTLYDDPEIQM